MTITLDLTPELQAQLQAEAEKRNQNPSEYIQTVVTEKLALQANAAKPLQRSLMELHGLGAELWRNIDVEKYINDSRDEWDRRP